jgi:hypothetical protein
MKDPGTEAARVRVAALLERSNRIQLQVVVVAPPDAERRTARDSARIAAIAAGRGVLLDEAVAAARDQVMRTFARSSFSGTWAFTDMAMSVTRAEDRVAAASAFEEAAIAEVVEDLVDAQTLDVLRSTTDELGVMAGVPSPGSIAAFGSPATGIRGPMQLALVGAFAILVAVVGLGIPSLATFALGLAIVAGLARRRSLGDG